MAKQTATIKLKYDKLEKRDRAARKLQGFFLRIMYKKALTKRQLRKPLVPKQVFDLRAHFSLRDRKLVNALVFVRQKICDQLVQRTLVYGSRLLAGSGLQKVQVTRAH